MPKTRESASPKAKKSTTANGHHPSHEQIALRAYQIYLERGATPGYEMEDWTRAERELTEEQKKPQQRGKSSAKAAGAAA